MRDGLTLNVEIRGEEGPSAVMIHGFMGSAGAWGDPLLEQLARHCRVVALDLLGHGQSSAPHAAERYQTSEMVEDVAEVIAVLGLDRPVLLGYSMGARIALSIGVSRPELIGGLLLEGGSPGLRTAAERAQRRQVDEDRALILEGEGMEAFLRYWEGLPLFHTQKTVDPVRLSQERERRLSLDPLALAACLRGTGTGTQSSHWNHLCNVAAPTLLIAGSLDVKFLDIAREMATEMPSALMVSVPGAGHRVHLERPDVWLGEATRFTSRGFPDT